MKIALIHDDFIQGGGAESLFATIASLWPDAPIYTSLVDWNKLPASINRNRVQSSFIQKIPLATKLYKMLLPLYPLAFESFDFSEFDLVISSTTRFAKSIITKPNTIHICYINSLPRFLWDKEIQKDYAPFLIRIFAKPLFLWLQRWDKATSSRVDFYIANSQNIAEKIEKLYGRSADIIYPFTNLSLFRPAKVHSWSLKSQDYFLIVSRLVKWKKIDIAIKAALELKINLKIVGTGPDGARLKKLVTSNQKLETRNQIEFIGKVDQNYLVKLYQNAKALIVTQEEDFGIAAAEAQACGIPVIASRHGGQSEIVVDGKTGILYKEQSPTSLADAILKASEVKWDKSVCRNNSLRFSQANFERNIKQKIRQYARKPS